MRKYFVVAAMALQVLFLVAMAGEREWIFRSGRVITLRTAPIDPRDPMRGDYALLSYEISWVPGGRCQGQLLRAFKDSSSGSSYRDRRVYAALQVDPSGVAEVVSLAEDPPPSGVFLRGRIAQVRGDSIEVRWGVEAIFLQQGKAKALEDEQRTTHAGTPLLVDVAVSSAGAAVVKSYRWAPLGLTLAFERAPVTRSSGNSRSTVAPAIIAATVQLKNNSAEAIAIIDLPGQQSFRLIVDTSGSFAAENHTPRWSSEDAQVPAPTASHVRVLQPGESFSTRIDFRDSRWFVTAPGNTEGKALPQALPDLGDLAGRRFRIEYAPPLPGAMSLSAVPIEWGRLRSRAFTPRTGID